MSNVTRSYQHQLSLKYGCNPHQNPSNIYALSGQNLPFSILNGKPGYINILDALNAWQLVLELKQALGLPAAASFKHVSPAGAAVATPIPENLRRAYGVDPDAVLTPAATAYLRARNADPKSSFGDFVALSDVVDEATALVLKSEVSDGIIAPGFEEKALEILKAKKSGNYVVLKADEAFQPPQQEFREVYGCVFEQRRNDVKITPDLFKNVVTKGAKELSPEAVRDLVLASITIKYTQSNSVGYALDGQMIGIGAGQQSRVDCVKLAGQKVEVWYLRQHPKVLNMQFSKAKKINRVTRINAMIRYVEGDFTDPEYKDWSENFEGVEIPEPLTLEEKKEFMKTLKGVSISSDAFFPFRDNIDQASKRGVQYIAQPGGSVADENVIKACEEYGMDMVFTSVRLFQH
jgi:phosphoribosylaminoimidazolecarboxamide formyltransferase / IMP cyclohydrolase